MPSHYSQTYRLNKSRVSKVDRSGRPLERGSNVTAKLQARRLPRTNGGRPDAEPAFVYIFTYPVSSC